MVRINSLAPGKFELNFRHVIFKQLLVTDSWDISCEIAPIWMSLEFTDDQSTLVQLMAWCRQATSHYLSRCWPRSLSPYGITRPHWGLNKMADILQTTISYSTALTELNVHQCEITNYTPYLARQGELRGVYYEDSVENWPPYNGSALCSLLAWKYSPLIGGIGSLGGSRDCFRRPPFVSTDRNTKSIWAHDNFWYPSWPNICHLRIWSCIFDHGRRSIRHSTSILISVDGVFPGVWIEISTRCARMREYLRLVITQI